MTLLYTFNPHEIVTQIQQKPLQRLPPAHPAEAAAYTVQYGLVPFQSLSRSLPGDAAGTSDVESNMLGR